jgi:hypothetical protein
MANNFRNSFFSSDHARQVAGPFNRRNITLSGFKIETEMTRKRIFREEMKAVVPWASLVGIIQGYAPVAKSGRPPFPIETMLRIH